MTATAAALTPPNPQFSHLADDPKLDATVRALEANGIHALVADNAAEAKRLVLELLPENASVFDGTSQTLTKTGIADAINNSGRFQSLRAQLMALGKEGKGAQQRQVAAAPDVIVGSVHAVTTGGQVVVASATGSQLGPYAFGAGRVIWVVGTQKIVPDLESALRRVQQYALPLESERAMKVYGQGSAVAKLLVINKEFQPGRITLVFVKENLGF